MQSYQTLNLQREEDVLTVTLNRENRANAVNLTMIKELIQLADWLREEREIKFVIFTNRGRLFSAGADLVELNEDIEDPARGSDYFRRMQSVGQEMMNKLERMEQITISALRGSAYGAGVAIMMTTDYRIMAESAVLNLPETNVGIFLTWGCTPRLVKAVGAVRAKELIMFCEDVSAEECKEIGFINKVVTADEMDDAVNQVIGKLRSKGNQSIRLSKKLVNASVAVNFGDIMITEPELVEKVVASGETEGKIQEFLRSKGKK